MANNKYDPSLIKTIVDQSVEKIIDKNIPDINAQLYKEALQVLKFIPTESESEKLKQYINKYYERFKTTKKGAILLEYSIKKPELEKIIHSGDPEEIKTTLKKLKNTKIFEFIFEELIKSGNVVAVQEMIKSPTQRYQKIKIDTLHFFLAVSHSSAEMLDMLINNANCTFDIGYHYAKFASNCITEERDQMLNHIIKKNMDLNPSNDMMNHALQWKMVNVQDALLDMGYVPDLKYLRQTPIPSERVDYIENRYNIICRHKELSEQLTGKPALKKTKI